jgi:hypothetical protein
MAQVTIINESDAPARSSGGSKGQTEAQIFARSLLQSMVAGKAARIGLEEGDNVRALKRAITSEANAQNTPVTYFLADEDSVLVVRHKA